MALLVLTRPDIARTEAAHYPFPLLLFAIARFLSENFLSPLDLSFIARRFD
jgi:hypothetical protein